MQESYDVRKINGVAVAGWCAVSASILALAFSFKFPTVVGSVTAMIGLASGLFGVSRAGPLMVTLRTKPLNAARGE